MVGSDATTGGVCHPGDIIIAGGAAGGTQEAANDLKSGDCYDPTGFGAVRSTIANMAQHRHGFMLAYIPNIVANNSRCAGKVVAAGGDTASANPGRTVEVYTIGGASDNTWATLKDASSNDILLSTWRKGSAVTALADGTFLMSGGFNSGGNAVASSEVFDPTTCSFGNVKAMTIGHAGDGEALLPASTLLPNGGVLACGGLDHSLIVNSVCEVYKVGGVAGTPNHGLDSWVTSYSSTTPPTPVTPMTAPRSTQSAVAFTSGGAGRVLMAGGTSQDLALPLGDSEECTETGCGGATSNVRPMVLRGGNVGDGATLGAPADCSMLGVPGELSGGPGCSAVSTTGSGAAQAALLTAGTYSGQILFCGGYTGLTSPATNGCEYYVPSGVTPVIGECATGTTALPVWCAGTNLTSPDVTMGNSRADFVMIPLPGAATPKIMVAAGYYAVSSPTIALLSNYSRRSVEFLNM